MAIVCLSSASLLAGVYVIFRVRWIFRQPVDNPLLRRISSYVSDGAMAFLSREYRLLAPFVFIVAGALFFANRGALRLQALAFVLGAVASGSAGFIGMYVATRANARTTHAAGNGLNSALRVSFAGGSVMGLSVVGLVLTGILIILLGSTVLFGNDADTFAGTILPILSGFSLGASSLALFARVGGGIFTKAADVGADLVGKVEAGIPEDDHRNPATIADNVGDNVGDVAGMGADLFESYAGSIVGTMILGMAVVGGNELRMKLTVLPLFLAAAGVVAALIGIRFVRARNGTSAQQALTRGTITAALCAAAFTYGVCRLLLGSSDISDQTGYLRIFLASVLGLAAGTALGFLTEYFTGTDTGPVRSIAKSCETGAATTIITGLGVGMFSSSPAIVVISASIIGSSALAGTYGMAIAALGMLMTLGIQLAVDAFGPIADNAGGLANMAGLPPHVRQVTDELDAVGNTSAAVGKGFAIGSAALTSVILFSAYRSLLGIGHIDLMSTLVLAGLFIGAMIPYLFSSMCIGAISRAAFAMIEEVRKQFREKPGILDESESPDYERCVSIASTSAIRGMVLPGTLAALLPVAVGFLGGVEMLAGMLIGVTVSGVVFAIFMVNSGGAWDNAKKMIEAKGDASRGTQAHTASIVGDTVGDPLKDAAGPSLNILIKLMGVVSLVMAPMLKSFWGL
jgi:K(+)-stimulated pyrophosphate-energized sodium pump